MISILELYPTQCDHIIGMNASMLLIAWSNDSLIIISAPPMPHTRMSQVERGGITLYIDRDIMDECSVCVVVT